MTVGGLLFPIRFLSRQTIVLCLHQLRELQKTVEDPQLSEDIEQAIEDLIRQDAVQSSLSELASMLPDDFMGDQASNAQHG
ncbi:MAG: hypothetical protein U1F68_14895 [Gammaproteobacteria bacterium]